MNTKPLKELGLEIIRVNEANGWNVVTAEQWRDANKVPAQLMLIVTEVSEAMEAFLKNDLANFEEEMADVLIRAISVAVALGIDIDAEVLAKIEVNRGRGLHHGGKRI